MEKEILDTKTLLEAQNIIKEGKINSYKAINNELVKTYWNLGRLIVEKQNGNSRANYGEKLIKELSIKLTEEFGGGYSKANLERFRLFYNLYPIAAAVQRQLSWTHYRIIMRVEKEKAREFYINEIIKNM